MSWSSVVISSILSLVIGWIIGERGLIISFIRNLYSLYKRRKDVINRLKECVKKSSLEKLKKCEIARNFNSDIGRILPKKSKLKFEEFCRKIEDYNIIHEAASMEVRKIMNKHIGELEEKFIPKENISKILSNINEKMKATIYKSFCDWFYENFHEEIMERILNNEEIDKKWFMRYAGKPLWRPGTKEEIVDLIEGRFLKCPCGYKKAYEEEKDLIEGRFLKCPCGYKKAYEEEKNCPNCGKKLELDKDIKRISFEEILEGIEETLKKDGFIRALGRFRKDAISASEKLIEAMEKDLKLRYGLFWKIWRIKEGDLEDVKEKLGDTGEAEFI